MHQMRYRAHLADDLVGNLSDRPDKIARLFARFWNQVSDATEHHFNRGHALHRRLMKIAGDTTLFGIAGVK